MKHILMKKSLECGVVIICLIFNLFGYSSSAEKPPAGIVSEIPQEECSFCGTGDASVLNKVKKMAESSSGKLERLPGVGLVNLNTGEWIDFQLWDTLSGKRGREEIHFGAEEGSTLQFQTMKDRGYTEGQIHFGQNSRKKDSAAKYFCDGCLEQGKESICEYAFTDCVRNRLIPIVDNHTFFLMGDFTVHMELDRLPEEVRFLISYAPEGNYWR